MPAIIGGMKDIALFGVRPLFVPPVADAHLGRKNPGIVCSRMCGGQLPIRLVGKDVDCSQDYGRTAAGSRPPPTPPIAPSNLLRHAAAFLRRKRLDRQNVESFL